jgi:hypothetical protein
LRLERLRPRSDRLAGRASAIAAFAEAGGDLKTIEMFPYAVGGRSCIVVQCSAFSWVYDLGSKWWHERASYGLTNWRATRSFNAFGKWLSGDSAGSRIVQITDAVKDEVGSPLPWMVESGPTSAFPAGSPSLKRPSTLRAASAWRPGRTRAKPTRKSKSNGTTAAMLGLSRSFASSALKRTASGRARFA